MTHGLRRRSRQQAVCAVALRAAAAGALVAGGLAIGSAAVGALAVGALAVGRPALRRGEDVRIARLHVGGPVLDQPLRGTGAGAVG